MLREDKLDLIRSEDNCVTFDDGEFHISSRKMREKFTTKSRIPSRKKTKAKTIIDEAINTNKQDQRSQKLTLRETKKAKSNRKVPNLTSVIH